MKHIGTQRLETERLILRKVRMEDAEKAFNNWCNSDKVSKYVLWEKHKSVDETKALYEIWIKAYEEKDTYRWIVELKDTHDVIGTIDVASKRYLRFNVAEIGYCYGEAYWNKGYGQEAVDRVVRYAFEFLEARSVTVTYHPENQAMDKIARKCGFVLSDEEYSPICRVFMKT